MKRLNPRRFRHLWIGLTGLGLAALPPLVPAESSDLKSVPAVTLERPGRPAEVGSVGGSAKAGFRFLAAGAVESTPLATGQKLVFPAAELNPPPQAPFQLLGGECMRLSGTLKNIDSTTIGFSVPWDDQSLRLPRAAARGVVQVPGESRIFADGFEGLDSNRWAIEGSPATVAGEHVGGRKSLRISPGVNRITHNLKEPLTSARIDLAFHDSGKVLAGNRCGVELTFRGPSGPKDLKIDLGWQEESLTVESPGGPALAVQRLARLPGWHRLSARFNAETTEISVDGKQLANGKGPVGPLTAVRLGSSTSANRPAPPTADDAAYHFDELQLTRFAEPPSSVEIDVTQDEARLIVGDQLFGSIERADAERIVMTVDTRVVDLPWSEVGGLYFRRVVATGTPVEGTLARVEWTPGAGADSRDLDSAEGALTEISATTIALATPYAGTLRLPRGLVRSITIQGDARRTVIDPASHHLGDEISAEPPLLDPPLPEGSTLERVLELPAPIDGPAFLALDVLQVVGEDFGLPFSDFIRKGELKTYVAIGGKRIDYLNRHIKTRNDTVERIRIPIPPGSLKAGKNVIRIEQTATADDPTGFDDLGILQMALEINLRPETSIKPTNTETP